LTRVASSAALAAVAISGLWQMRKLSSERPALAAPLRTSGIMTLAMYSAEQIGCGRTPSATSPATWHMCVFTAARWMGYWCSIDWVEHWRHQVDGVVGSEVERRLGLPVSTPAPHRQVAHPGPATGVPCAARCGRPPAAKLR
jgi:hypothetical protein